MLLFALLLMALASSATSVAFAQAPSPSVSSAGVPNVCVPADSTQVEPTCSTEEIQPESRSGVEGPDLLVRPATFSAAGLHPVSVGVLTGEQLERMNPATVPDLLTGRIAGTYSLDVGARNDLFRTIRIRGPNGFANCPTCGPKILLDGVEVNPAAVGSLSARHLERVEVVRGPQASLLYGSDAASGVVNLFSRKGPELAGTQVRASATIATVSSPYVPESGLSRSIDASLGGRFPSLAYSLGVSHTALAGHVPEYDSDARTVSFGFSGHAGNSHLITSARFSDRHFTRPGEAVAYHRLYSDGLLPGLRGRIDDDDFGDYRNLTLGVSLSYQPTGWWRSSLTIGNDLLELDLREVPTLAPGDSLLFVQTERFSLPSLRFVSGVELPLGREVLSLHAGVDRRTSHRLRHDSFHRSTGYVRVLHWRGEIHEEEFTAGGGFAEGQVRLRGGLSLSGGIRADTHSSFGEDFGGWSWNPRGGIAHSLSLARDWTLQTRAVWAKGIAAPTREMRIGKEGVGPNEAIGPQTTSGWEMGLALVGLGDRLRADATVFYQMKRDPLGLLFSNPGEEGQLFRNYYGRIVNAGTEFALRWRGATTDLSVNLSAVNNSVRSRIESTITPSPTGALPVLQDATPKKLGWVEAQHQLGWLIGSELYVGGRLTHLGRRRAHDIRAVRTAVRDQSVLHDDHSWFPAITRGDLFLGARFTRSLHAHVEIRNVTDNLASEVPEIVLPGRQFQVRITAAVP